MLNSTAGDGVDVVLVTNRFEICDRNGEASDLFPIGKRAVCVNCGTEDGVEGHFVPAADDVYVVGVADGGDGTEAGAFAREWCVESPRREAAVGLDLGAFYTGELVEVDVGLAGDGVDIRTDVDGFESATAGVHTGVQGPGAGDIAAGGEDGKYL